MLPTVLLAHIASFFWNDDGRWDLIRLFRLDSVCTATRIDADVWRQQCLLACEAIKPGILWPTLLMVLPGNTNRWKMLARSMYKQPDESILVDLVKAVVCDDVSWFVKTLLSCPQALVTTYWPSVSPAAPASPSTLSMLFCIPGNTLTYGVNLVGTEYAMNKDPVYSWMVKLYSSNVYKAVSYGPL